MMGVGAMEMLLLLLVSGGGLPDLVSAVDPAQYFEARQVEVTLEKMADLAGEAPADAKAQVMQLLALRYLGENAEKLKKADKYAAYRAVLEAVAGGKKAQDPQGFAKEYAQRALARLDGKDMPVAGFPTLAGDALEWFPADATLVAALDTRPLRQAAPVGFSPSDLFKKLPQRERTAFYDVIEKTGNVRVDRIAFAYVHDDKPDNAKIYVRLTGKANAAWIVDGLKQVSPNKGLQTTQRKDADGKAVTLMQVPNQPPVFALVGDTDMMIVGYAGNAMKHEAVLDDVLAVRGRKKLSASAGPLKDRLRKVPKRAMALVVGDLPESMRRGFTGLVKSGPSKVDAHVERIAPGLDISVVGTMANPAEAQEAVTAISKMRKEGIDALQQMLKQPDAAPRVPANALINVLESLQMQSEGAELRLRLLVPHDIMRSMVELSGIGRMFGN